GRPIISLSLAPQMTHTKHGHALWFERPRPCRMIAVNAPSALIIGTVDFDFSQVHRIFVSQIKRSPGEPGLHFE
ncbi:hypothetical protein, partial [Sinorhizobium meliloti]|uniref:hypothetical protein n=1 Tax=Rhizobium meliloti TaxID=382 RepID=UPI001AECAA0E